jgi:hypothetical protein
MEEEMDIQPPVNPKNTPFDGDKESVDNPTTGANAPQDPCVDKGSVPLYEDLHAIAPAEASAAEAALLYSHHLQNAPGFPWQPERKEPNPTPCFAAPYITGGDSNNLTYSQVISGIFLNIPRSPKLWVGDQLKLRWGHNTFYTTVAESKGRDGPRMVQYLNNESLVDYESGIIEVHYEVVRRSRFVGISETLCINLNREGRRRRKSAPRPHAARRRRMSP